MTAVVPRWEDRQGRHPGGAATVRSSGLGPFSVMWARTSSPAQPAWPPPSGSGGADAADQPLDRSASVGRSRGAPSGEAQESIERCGSATSRHRHGFPSGTRPRSRAGNHRRRTTGGQGHAATRGPLLGRERLWRAGIGGKARRRRRHAAPVRGNPMNLKVGCGTQQAREPVGGGSRRGREERRGRNERGAGRRRAEAGESPWEWTPAGTTTERRSLRQPYGRRSACTSRAAARCVSDSGHASSRRAVRTHVHTARSRGTTTRSHLRSRTEAAGPSPGKPHDPEPRAVKQSRPRTRLSTAAGDMKLEGTRGVSIPRSSPDPQSFERDLPTDRKSVV